MEIAYTVLFFIYGIVLGSFFNVVGLRVPKKESIVKPPSHCPKCKRRLTVVDLIPVFSYLFLRGKCHSCGTKISPIYVMTEFVTGMLFAFSYWYIGFSFELIVAILFVSLLMIIIVSDIAYMLIPDKVLLFFLPLLVVGRILSPLEPWWDSLLGAAVGFGILLFIAIVQTLFPIGLRPRYNPYAFNTIRGICHRHDHRNHHVEGAKTRPQNPITLWPIHRPSRHHRLFLWRRHDPLVLESILKCKNHSGEWFFVLAL